MQGKALSIYLPSYLDSGTGTGRNICHARTLHVYLSHGEVTRVDLIQQASGTYLYPSDAARKILQNPASLDSLLPAWQARHRAPAGGDSTAAPDLMMIPEPVTTPERGGKPDSTVRVGRNANS